MGNGNGTPEKEVWDNEAVAEARSDAERKAREQTDTEVSALRQQHNERLGQKRKEREDLSYQFSDKKKLEDKKKQTIERNLTMVKTYEIGQISGINKYKDLRRLEWLNIVMLGPTGAGKSSFINMVDTLANCGSHVITQDGGAEGTAILEHWKPVENAMFELFDTRGVFEFSEQTVNVFKAICSGEVKEGEEIIFEKFSSPSTYGSNAQPLQKCMHAVLLVFDAADAKLKSYTNKDASKSLHNIKEFFSQMRIEPCCLFMHNSKTTQISHDEFVDLKEQISSKLGIAQDRLFEMRNTVAAKKVSVEDKFILSQIVKYLLICGERCIKSRTDDNQKQVGIDVWIENLSERRKISIDKFDCFRELLDENGVYTTDTLRENWEDLREDLLPHLTIGMRKIVETGVKEI